MTAAAASAAAASQKGLSLAGQAFFGSLCLGTLSLGVWQTSRYFEKVQLVELRQKDLQLEPVEDGWLALREMWNQQSQAQTQIQTQQRAPAQSTTTQTQKQTLQQQSPPSFRRLRLVGHYDHTRECLVGPRGPPPGALPDGPGTSAQGMSSAPQGYFVITPMKLVTPSNNNNNSTSNQPVHETEPTMVLVNRGWVPRHRVVADRRRSPPPPRSMSSPSRNNNTTTPNDPSSAMLLQWDRPTGMQAVTVVPTKYETPKSYLIAQHDWQSHPPRLFWYDVAALQEATMDITTTSTSTTQENDNEILPPPVPLVTLVRDNDQDGNGHTTASSSSTTATPSWPVVPPANQVGNFTLTPAVHAGYAFTWYGLATAGTYMTTRLMRRGGK